MAKTKHKKKHKKPQVTNNNGVIQQGDMVIAYEAGLVGEAIGEAAQAARSEILKYSLQYKSANGQRPLVNLAERVGNLVLDSFELSIAESESREEA